MTDSNAHPPEHHATGPLWFRIFMGHSAGWYKLTVFAFLVLNPLLYFALGRTFPEVRGDVAVYRTAGTPPLQGPGAPIEGFPGLTEVTVLDSRVAPHEETHGPSRGAVCVLALPADVAGDVPKEVRVITASGDARILVEGERVNDVLLSGGAHQAGFVVGWLVLAEFIFTLAMALKCYPLLPAGLLTLEVLVMGLCSPAQMYHEAEHNFPVILLLVFVVAGVNFLKEWLATVFTAILFSTRSKLLLSLLFVFAGALLSAFLDALTVTAVIIAVCKGFYDLYNNYRSQVGDTADEPLEEFRAFLRSLVMHALVGTALGGVMTMVGEPQNLLIAKQMSNLLDPLRAQHWGFVGFVTHMAVVTVPTLVVGLFTTVLVEKLRLFGHGARMPEAVREVLLGEARRRAAERTPADRWRLRVQGACAILLVIGLGFHLAEVGILGLFLIVLSTSFTGVNDEHRIGQAFTESLPFTALLVVFFGIVAMIAAQDLFRPVIDVALAQESKGQLVAFFSASALLSAISDNVFVATVFINEASAAFVSGRIDGDQFEKLAIAINCGTNIPSVATPNGQAAFLFLLTSALAAPIKLDYLTMIKMALPYTVLMTAISLGAVWLLL